MRLLIATATLLALSGCMDLPAEPDNGGGSGGDAEAEAEAEAEANMDRYVKQVRRSVPQIRAYDRGAIEAMAEQVCSLGSIDLGVRVLDNYSAVPAVDRDAVARIALQYACPDA